MPVYLNAGNGMKQLYSLDTSNPTNMNVSSDPDDLRQTQAALSTALDQVTRVMSAFGVSSTLSGGTTTSGATVTSGGSTTT